MNFEHHDEAGCLAAFLEGLPFKLLQHGSHTVSVSVMVPFQHKPRSPALDHLNTIDVLFAVRVPDNTTVLHMRSNKGEVCLLAQFLWTSPKIAAKEPKNLVGFPGGIRDVGLPREV